MKELMEVFKEFLKIKAMTIGIIIGIYLFYLLFAWLYALGINLKYLTAILILIGGNFLLAYWVYDQTIMSNNMTDIEKWATRILGEAVIFGMSVLIALP